jgi:protein-S-isoprenylcysteine O-methyltransferase Ste14
MPTVYAPEKHGEEHMMESMFLIPAGLFLLCLVIRAVYELLKEDRKIDLESKSIFAVIFASMCILWLSWFSLCPSDPYHFDLPDAVRWTGLALVVAGTILAVGALVQLRGVENINNLATTGLFRKLRHPMYAGFILWIVGWSVYHDGVVSLALGAVGIASVLWWRRLEEARLLAQFGSRYGEYRLSTWF